MILTGVAVLVMMASCSSGEGTLDEGLAPELNQPETSNPGTNNQDALLSVDSDWSLTSSISVDDADKEALVGINGFADKLMQGLADISADGNFCVSPVSVSMYISMMANAIEGEAKSQILGCLSARDVEHLNSLNEKLMHYLPCEENGSALDINNRLWVNHTIQVPECFRTVVGDSYNAKVESVDFGHPAAADTINNWVASKTRGLINVLMESDWRDYVGTPMVSANAVYFKGDWRAEFDESESSKAKFYGVSGVKEVRMMHRKLYASYAANEKLQMLQLEFRGPANVLELYLPSEEVAAKDIVKMADMDTRDELRAALQEFDVNLRLPSFKSESKQELKSVLKTMGLTTLDKVDFSAMGVGLMPFDVAHRALFKVDEKGAEAAAVTYTWFTSNFTDEKPKQVSLDFNRPFMYLLRNRDTNVVLMAGVVANPE